MRFIRVYVALASREGTAHHQHHGRNHSLKRELGSDEIEDKAKQENGKKNVSLGWYVVPNIVARRKASQALREDSDPEKRKAKRARFLAKKKRKEALMQGI